MSKSTSWWEQAVQNRLVAAVLAMVVLIPLLATPLDQSRHGVAAMAFEGFALVLLATLLWRSQWNFQRAQIMAFLKTGANLPVLLLLALAVVSCIFSPNKAYSLQETLRLGAGVLLYFVVAYQFRRSEYLTKLVDVLLFLAAATSLLGFAQFARNTEVYAVGMFGDHQLFGSFLMLLLPIAAVTAITETKTNRQIAAQITTVLTGACLLLTHTRSAWLGAAAGMVALAGMAAYALSRRAKVSGRKHEWLLPVMLLCAAAGFFLTVSPDRDTIIDRAGTLMQAKQETGWQYREQSARGAFAMLRERPLMGWGIGLYPVYQRPYTHTGNDLHGAYRRPFLNEQAHDLYLQTAVELGVPGLVLLVSIVIMFLVAGLHAVRNMEAGVRRNLLLGSMASTVAFAVDAAGSPAWQIGQNSMFLWLMLGLGVGCLRGKPKPVAEAPVPALPRLVLRPVGAFATLGLAALLPLTAFAAVGPSYTTFLGIALTPNPFSTKSNIPVTYTVTATYQDPNTLITMTDDVTSLSTITKTAGAGNMTGPNNRIYTPRPRELDIARVQATFTFNNQPAQSTATLFVSP